MSQFTNFSCILCSPSLHLILWLKHILRFSEKLVLRQCTFWGPVSLNILLFWITVELYYPEYINLDFKKLKKIAIFIHYFATELKSVNKILVYIFFFCTWGRKLRFKVLKLIIPGKINSNWTVNTGTHMFCILLLVSWVFHNQVLRSGWLKQQRFIFSQLWMLEALDQGVSRVSSKHLPLSCKWLSYCVFT